MFDWAYDFVVLVIDTGGYAGVFALLLFETMFPPMPSEVILPLAGMRAATGPLGLPGVILAATAGAMTGNYLWYRIARAIGLERLNRFVLRHGRWLGIDWADIERCSACSTGTAAAPSSSPGCCPRSAPSSRSRPAS